MPHQEKMHKFSNDENAHALDYLNGNEGLKNLMIKALNKSIDNLTNNQSSKPFLITEKQFFEATTGNINTDIEEIEKQAKLLKDERLLAYSFAGTLGAPPEVKWETQNAVFVKGFDFQDGKGVLLVQMYKPKDTSHEFELISGSMVQPISVI